MKVILLQDIYKHGVAGEVVEVADGFARNYLIPRGMANRASDKALADHAELMEQVELRRAAYENKLNEVARLIDGTELIFERRAANTGTLFGSVTTVEIADELEVVTGVDINRRRISQQPLRELGNFQIPVRLGSEITPMLSVIVVREGELQDFLAAREAAAEGEVIDPNTLAPEGADEDEFDAEVAEDAVVAEAEEIVEEAEIDAEAVAEEPEA